jgi:hypothetical protein
MPFQPFGDVSFKQKSFVPWLSHSKGWHDLLQDETYCHVFLLPFGLTSAGCCLRLHINAINWSGLLISGPAEAPHFHA